MAWVALRAGPPLQERTVSPEVSLMVVFSEPERWIEIERVDAAEEEWKPVAMPFLVPEQATEMEAPAVAQPVFDEAHASDERQPEETASPYWEEIRRELARALRWPAGWNARTNVAVRLLALEEGLLPLAPSPDANDAIQVAVRKAVERAARRASRPPDYVVGREMRLTVRFEPES